MHLSIKVSTVVTHTDIMLTLKGDTDYHVSLETGEARNITRIDNQLDRIPVELAEVKERLAMIHEQVENAKAELTVPFRQEQELAEKSARLVELDAELNMDGKLAAVTTVDADTPETRAAKSLHGSMVKPSIAERVKANQEYIKASHTPTTPDKAKDKGMAI
jgi:multidrug efflux pump subunit AcrA (membrane-fusion protein)